MRYLGDLAYRWLRLDQPEPSPSLDKELVRIKGIVADLCERAGMGAPEVVPITREEIFCGAVPIIKQQPVLVFCPSVTAQLFTDEDMEGMLAHELGHIKQMRRDGFPYFIKAASIISFKLGRTPELWAEEFAADAFAKELLGGDKFRACLQKIADCVDDEKACFTHPPLSARLALL